MARQPRRNALRRQPSVSSSASSSSSSSSFSSSSSASSSSPPPSPFSALGVLFNDKALQALSAVDRLSGFRITFAFLSSLRANLQISSSLEDLHSLSNSATTTNTPDSLRPVFATTPNQSQLNVSLSPNNDTTTTSIEPRTTQEHDETLPPPLTTFRATSEEHKTESLRLIADSVAQQRQTAARYIIFRPETLAASALILAIVTKLLYRGSTGNLALVCTWTACTMAGLLGVRWATSGYLDLAERTGTWAWLGEGLGAGTGTRSNNNNNEEDEVLITTYGDEVIGTLVLRAVKDGPDNTRHSRTSSTSSAKSSSSKGNSRRKNSSRFSTGVIRAWTVKRMYRRKEVGTGLLEEAISTCRARGLNGPVFAVDHANSGKVLSDRFHGGFVRWDGRVRGFLERVIREGKGR